MPAYPRLTLILLVGLMVDILAGAAQAADPPRDACLSKAEQRAALASHQAISLAKAISSAHKHGRHGEVLRARLCHHGDGLAYSLTLLARNGKVTRVTVDAANGELIKGR
jgi:uncharacterized membrane protein YkoI